MLDTHETRSKIASTRTLAFFFFAGALARAGARFFFAMGSSSESESAGGSDSCLTFLPLGVALALALALPLGAAFFFRGTSSSLSSSIASVAGGFNDAELAAAAASLASGIPADRTSPEAGGGIASAVTCFAGLVWLSGISSSDEERSESTGLRFGGRALDSGFRDELAPSLVLGRLD